MFRATARIASIPVEVIGAAGRSSSGKIAPRSSLDRDVCYPNAYVLRGSLVETSSGPNRINMSRRTLEEHLRSLQRRDFATTEPKARRIAMDTIRHDTRSSRLAHKHLYDELSLSRPEDGLDAGTAENFLGYHTCLCRLAEKDTVHPDIKPANIVVDCQHGRVARGCYPAAVRLLRQLSYFGDEESLSGLRYHAGDEEANSQVPPSLWAERTMDHVPHKPLQEWPEVDDEAFEDLVRGLINLDPAECLTARQVLEHLWFAHG